VEHSEVRIQTGDGELAAWVYRPDTPDEPRRTTVVVAVERPCRSDGRRVR
jgi:hypothetical protein